MKTLASCYLAIFALIPVVAFAALHPQCSNEENIRINKTEEVLFQVSTHAIAIDCIAYELVLERNAPSTCTQSHLDDHSLVIEPFTISSSLSRGSSDHALSAQGYAISTSTKPRLPLRLSEHVFSSLQRPIAVNDSNRLYTTNLAPLLKGSILETSYYFDGAVGVQFVLRYAHAITCPVRLHMAATIYGSTRRVSYHNVPYLDSYSPEVIWANQPATFYFKRAYPDNATLAELVAVVQDHEECSNRGGTATDVGTVSTTDHGSGFRWTAKMPNQGGYRLCVKAGRNPVYHETAFLSVHGGNPAFFRVLSQRQSGSLIDVSLLVVGRQLNERSDVAVLISNRIKCASGVTNSRSVEGRLRLTQKVTGSDHAYVDVSLSRGGLFRLCYKRGGSVWESVLSFSALSLSGKIASLNTTANFTQAQALAEGYMTTSPAAASGRYCGPASVPPTGDLNAELLELTLDTPRLPSDFAQKLATFLCVSTDVIYLHSASPVGAHQLELVVELDCDSGRLCNKQGRMQYLLWAVQQRTTDDLQISIAKGTTYSELVVRNSAEPNNVDPSLREKDGQGRTLIVVAVIVVVVVIAILVVVVVVLVIKKRKVEKDLEHARDDPDGDDGRPVVQGVIVPQTQQAHVETEMRAPPVPVQHNTGGQSATDPEHVNSSLYA